MRPFLLFGILALAGCAAPSERIDVALENRTSRPLVLRLRAGILSRELRLAPGRTWLGWLPWRLAGASKVEIVIEEGKGDGRIK